MAKNPEVKKSHLKFPTNNTSKLRKIKISRTWISQYL